MHQALLLIDFVCLDAVLVSQSENAVLSWSNISAAKINPLGFFVLGEQREK